MASEVSAGHQLQTINEVISIDDLNSRKYNLDDLTTELQLLKNKISTLRYEMISLMRLLATVNEESNRTPQDFFSDMQNKITTLKEDIDSYIERYRKIQPLVAFAKKELGKNEAPRNNVGRFEVKIGPPIFATNQQLISNNNTQQQLQTDLGLISSSTSTRGGRGGSKRGSTTRKPRGGGRGGSSSTVSQRQNSKGAKSGQTPQSAEYLGATPSEPILL